jgi:signal transduction histidine kinase
VAHNFNNALAAILGRTQLLLRSITDEKHRRSLQVIETATQDAAEIVRRIQTFARRAPSAQFSRVSLARLITDAVQLTRTSWEDDAHVHSLNYDVHFINEAEGDDLIEANSSEVREVFVNLIFNALDAMPRGGQIEFRESKRDESLVVVVRDTGEGILPELQQRIFEPFFTTKGSQGSGLGLAVSYGIIKRHGGTIEVSSTSGRGTIFTLTFPRA